MTEKQEKKQRTYTESEVATLMKDYADFTKLSIGFNVETNEEEKIRRGQHLVHYVIPRFENLPPKLREELGISGLARKCLLF